MGHVVGFQYDREADALAVVLRPGAKSARTVKVTNTVNVDLDAKGRVTLLEVICASWNLDRKTLEALPAPPNEWLTLAAAERESGLRASTLRVLLNRGRLEGEKRGRDWFVEALALMNYMESREARGRQAMNPKGRRRVG